MRNKEKILVNMDNSVVMAKVVVGVVSNHNANIKKIPVSATCDIWKRPLGTCREGRKEPRRWG